MIQLLLAGFILGSVSSFHCVGMCGPLALALPVQNLAGWNKMVSLVLYHLGRISVYAAFGLIFALAGRQIYLAGFQEWFSIGLGIVMLVVAGRFFFNKQIQHPARLNKLYRLIQGWIFYLWKSPGRSGFFLLGAANGLLPCGMVYLAIAGALNTSQIPSGMLFMAMFGLGTLPPLFSLAWFGSNIKMSFRNRIRQLTPYLITTMAIILIVRGLNLGIPFISPLLGAARSPAVICH